MQSGRYIDSFTVNRGLERRFVEANVLLSSTLYVRVVFGSKFQILLLLSVCSLYVHNRLSSVESPRLGARKGLMVGVVLLESSLHVTYCL